MIAGSAGDVADAGIIAVDQRIAVLDLIRGIAVLGILAVNIAGFAGPIAPTDSPALVPLSHADKIAYIVTFLVFEGKMRALFSMLFGASMCLFIERVDARISSGRASFDQPSPNGAALQLRRLGWLMLFGWLHYILFWWGDILFVYAVAGAVVLAWRGLPIRALVAIALVIFAAWHLHGGIGAVSEIRAEQHVAAHRATPAEIARMHVSDRDAAQRIADDLRQFRLGYGAQVAEKLTQQPGWPVVMTAYTLGETVPLMLIGVALYRSGFFHGRWRRRRLAWMAVAGIGGGGAMAAALTIWAAARGFPHLAMTDIAAFGAAPEHLAMALGYAAALMLGAPWLLTTALGQRVAAAGQMAFSNYLGTTMVMTAIFYGWGLGLVGQVGRAWQTAFVVVGWTLMLAWSKPWLVHFRQGPLEWVWRSLTQWRRMPMRRAS